MEDETSGNALLKWLGDNPEATNMGIGFIKSLGEKKRQDAAAANEIAKSQYGYLLNQGIGDMSKAQGPSMADRLMQGYVAGTSQRQSNEMNKAIQDMLRSKAALDKAGAVSKQVDTQKPFQALVKEGVITESTDSPESWSEALNRSITGLGATRQPDYAVDFNANPAPIAPTRNPASINNNPINPRTGMPINNQGNAGAEEVLKFLKGGQYGKLKTNRY